MPCEDFSASRSAKDEPCIEEEIEDASKAQIEAAILEVVSDPHLNSRVAAWYMGPEELRPSIAGEKEWLQRTYAAIQAHDPLQRPAWMYQPQHMSGIGLAALGPWMDALSMGVYPNIADLPTRRIQVRHAMTQLNQANALLGYSILRPPKLVLPALEMFESTEHPLDPVDADRVAEFARHDANGADGVLVFSMGSRVGFESYPDYYGGWASVARETFDLGLREVLRHGTVIPATTATVIDGPITVDFDWPDVVHATYPSISLRHYVHEDVDYVLAVNSADIPVSVAVGPLSAGSWSDLFGDESYAVPASNAFIDLPEFGVVMLVQDSRPSLHHVD